MFRRLIERARFLLDHRWSPRHMSEYLDGELARDGRDRIERHVHDCHRCRALLSSLRATVASLRGIGGDRGDEGDASVAPDVLAGFRQRVGASRDDDRLD